MPIFRIGQDLHYYAHVPKCAGVSVERYLKERFGSLAFVNNRFHDAAERDRWTKTSPQHVAQADFEALVPKDWIVSSFAVVRHPFRRVLSSFLFQAEVEGKVDPAWGIDEWAADWMARFKAEPFLYDNHLRPQTSLVPVDAAVFKLEDGLAAIVPHLDALAGNTDGPREVPRANEAAGRAGGPRRNLVPSPAIADQLARFYLTDFRRFGYEPDPAVFAADAARIEARAAPGLIDRLTRRLGKRA